jgi:hypothetical protein
MTWWSSGEPIPAVLSGEKSEIADVDGKGDMK